MSQCSLFLIGAGLTDLESGVAAKPLGAPAFLDHWG
jgi:hypothetical protein